MNTARPLRTALLANALFSVGCGLAMIVHPAWIGALLGFEAPLVFLIVGIGLVLFAMDLIHQASQTRPRTWRALYASAADLLWVIGSIAGVLLFGEWLSASGMIVVLVVAAIVLAFGVWQLWGIDRAHRNHETGLHRHCILVDTDGSADAIWNVIRDLGAISHYMPALRESVLLDGREPGIGAVRHCVDRNARAWSEQCTAFSDSERSLVLRFLADEPGFPFPARSMTGGWQVLPAQPGATVMVWWELEPKPRLLAPVMLPLLAFGVDRDISDMIRRMAAAATGADPDAATTSPASRYTRLLAQWC